MLRLVVPPDKCSVYRYFYMYLHTPFDLAAGDVGNDWVLSSACNFVLLLCHMKMCRSSCVEMAFDDYHLNSPAYIEGEDMIEVKECHLSSNEIVVANCLWHTLPIEQIKKALAADLVVMVGS